MNDIVFLFPGQGSQHAGMGKGLAESYAGARHIFEEADETLGFALSRLCFEGPNEELQKTANTQAALLTVSVAAQRVLAEQGYTAGLLAGHSLGEYSALVAAGCLAFSDALRLVRKRGLYMQEAVPEGRGAMAAIVKLPEGKLEELLAEASQGEVLEAANFNSPEQVVIAGQRNAVERAVELAKAAGARLAKVLPVSAPFHCSLMRPAQQRMRAELDSTEFRDLAIPLINNWQARQVTKAADAREGLYQQIPNPVRWTDSMRRLTEMGSRRFVEVGPGTVLTKLARATAAEWNGVKFGEPSDLESMKALLDREVPVGQTEEV